MKRTAGSAPHWLIWAFVLVIAAAISGCYSQPSPPTPAVASEAGVVIGLVQGQDPIPKSRKIWRSQREDHVRWENRSNIDRIVRFQPSIWPFSEDQIDIKVPANGNSDWFTIGGAYTIRQYTYKVIPPVKEDEGQGPPGDPDISGGD